MEQLDVLAAAAATSAEGGGVAEASEGSGEQPVGLSDATYRKRKRQAAARGPTDSTPPASVSTDAAGAGPGSGPALTKAAVVARAADEHGARISKESSMALADWLGDVHQQLAAADMAFLQAREAHQQADAERAAARNAYRADQGNAHKSAEWHAKVAAAHEAHEDMRSKREALYSWQALAELLSRELQRRKGNAAGIGTDANAAAAGQLLAAPSPQGTKRKRGAPPEQCPFCEHSYTVRDGLSNQLDATGSRLHLRKCQCRKRTPPCKNCPNCKHLPDVMQLMGDEAAAFELCQRVHSCAICACSCPGAGKWVEGDDGSRQAFKERTQKRQDQLAELGWQEGLPATAHQQPTSTAGGTASVVTTAAPAASAALTAEGQQQPKQAQAGRSGIDAPRRLPADIRQQLAQRQHQQEEQQHQAESQLPSRQQHWEATPGHGNPAAETTGCRSPRRARHSPPIMPTRQRPSRESKQHQHQHQHAHWRHTGPGHPEHFHTCSHPHEDCNSDCCSAPTVAPFTAGTAAAAAAAGLPEHPLLQSPASLAALATALEAVQHAQQASSSALAPASAALTLASNPGLMRLLEQLAAAAAPVMPKAQQQQQLADSGVELPPEVLSLVHEVFAHTKGEAGASAVAAFLRSQCMTSLGDFEFLELDMLERGLGPDMPRLLLNKFLQLGRKRAAMAAEVRGEPQQQT